MSAERSGPGDVVVERGVWLAFTARRVAVHEFDGRDTHAAVLQPDEVLDPQWREEIDEAPAAWFLTHLQRSASGVDVRRTVSDDHARLHGGGSPPTVEWAIRLERRRSIAGDRSGPEGATGLTAGRAAFAGLRVDHEELVDQSALGQGEQVTAPSTTTAPRLAPLYAAGFVTAFGANGIAAAVGGEHLELGLTLAWLGLFLALYDVAELVLKPVFGALSDRIGPRPVIVGGLVVFAAASLIGVFGTGPLWLGLARLLQGAGASAFSPASSAAVARLVPAHRRGTYFGRYGSWKGLGYAGGPVIGALVVQFGSTQWLFGILVVMALVTAVAVLIAVEPIEPLPRQRATLAVMVRAATDRRFLTPVVVLAVGSAAIGALTGMLPALGTEIGIPLLVSSLAVAVLAVTSSLVQPVAGRLHDAGRLGTGVAGVAGTAAVAAAFLVVAVAPSAVAVFIAALLAGAGVATLTPVAFAHLAGTTPPDRLGRTMGSAELGRETGDAVGPLVVGGVGSAIGLPFGFAAFAVVALVGTLVASRSPSRTAAAQDA